VLGSWVTRAVGTAAVVVGAIVGLVTGVGTLVAWASSDSLAEALNRMLPIGGVVATGLLAATYIRDGIRSPETGRGVAGGILAVLGALLLATGGVRAFAGIGFAALLFAPIGIGVSYWQAAVAARAARKRCPDRAEDVKDAARVCRYCGWRLASPPGSGQ
jgi:hypothetical protein